MTQQPQETRNQTAVPAHTGATVNGQESRPVFFFDGDFWRRQQLERRAQLNRAITAYIFSGMPRGGATATPHTRSRSLNTWPIDY